MVSSKRFLIIFASIFMLGSVPLLMSQPNGLSTAGLNVGIITPLENIWHLAMLGLMGLYAAYLRSSNAVLLIPLSFILMFVVGMSIASDLSRYALLPGFLLGAVMLYALCFLISRSEQVIMGMVIAGSFGFHFGGYYVELIPSIAAPLYFMLGNILAISLIFAVSVSLGMIFFRTNRRKFIPPS